MLYRENRPKSENWATLTPRSSATVRRGEKLTRPWKLPVPSTTTWSKQYLSAVHFVTCSLPALSEVPVWPNFDFRFCGQMTSKVKIFENVFQDSSTGHGTTFRDQIWWKLGFAKLPKGTVDKKTWAPRDSSQAPFCQTFRERCHPLTCPRIPNLVRIGCALPNLFRKDWFFGPKSNYNVDWKPTIKLYNRRTVLSGQ